MIAEWDVWKKNWEQQAAEETACEDHVNAARHLRYAQVAHSVINAAKERANDEHRS